MEPRAVSRIVFGVEDRTKRLMALAVGIIPLILLMGPGGLADTWWMWALLPLIIALAAAAALHTRGVDIDAKKGIVPWRGFGSPMMRQDRVDAEQFDALEVREVVFRGQRTTRHWMVHLVVDDVPFGLSDGVTLYGFTDAEMALDRAERIAQAAGLPFRGLNRDHGD